MKDLTWWEASDFARAGHRVRRLGSINPMRWFAYGEPGLFFLNEETNLQLPYGVEAIEGDPDPRVVRNTDFGESEFLAADWTTDYPEGYPPDDVLPEVDPPPDPGYDNPPGDGGGDGSGGGGSDGGGGGNNPPTPPPGEPPSPPLPPPAAGGGGDGGSSGGGSSPPVPPGNPPVPNPPGGGAGGAGGGSRSNRRPRRTSASGVIKATDVGYDLVLEFEGQWLWGINARIVNTTGLSWSITARWLGNGVKSMGTVTATRTVSAEATIPYGTFVTIVATCLESAQNPQYNNPMLLHGFYVQTLNS